MRVAPMAETSIDNVDECIKLARYNRRELRRLAGFSLVTGRTRRIAFRMRRAGAILLAFPALERALHNKPLRTVLEAAELAGKGKRYSYGSVT